jgi:hypothetical protein
MADEVNWHDDRTVLAVAVAYAILTLLGVAISTGVLVPDSWFVVGSEAPATQVPEYVYLYAFLGASAYAFSNMLRKDDRQWRDLVRLGTRVLAALPLAAGIYLLGSFLGGGANVAGGRAAAGLAFLTGLYVNLALEGLYGLGTRLYGLSPPESDGSEEDTDETDGGEDETDGEGDETDDDETDGEGDETDDDETDGEGDETDDDADETDGDGGERNGDANETDTEGEETSGDGDGTDDDAVDPDDRRRTGRT